MLFIATSKIFETLFTRHLYRNNKLIASMVKKLKKLHEQKRGRLFLWAALSLLLEIVSCFEDVRHHGIMTSFRKSKMFVITWFSTDEKNKFLRKGLNQTKTTKFKDFISGLSS